MLVDHEGLAAGSNLCLNSGRVGHSDILTPTGGLSKSVVMALSLLVAPKPIHLIMDFDPAWTAFDVSQVTTKFIPVLYALCEGLDDQFWVSNFEQCFRLGLP